MNNNNYILSCCSTADLSLNHLNRRDINYVSFHFSVNNKEYIDDLGQSLSYDEFYKLLRNGAETKTSQVNVEQFINYFTPFLEDGKDILHVSVSYGISGAYNSAVLARDILLEDYPDRKIIIINSLAASGGYGLLMDKIADLRDDNTDLDSLVNWIESNKLRVNHWFYSGDLSYFVKGGRISKASGFIGGVLNIYPIMHVDSKGKLIPLEKTIGKKRAQKKILDKMIEFADLNLDYNDKVFLNHSDILEDATTIKEMIEKRFLNLDGEVLINSVGTTIGSHTGPGTIALFYWGKKRDS